jgi:hypothetical protein
VLQWLRAAERPMDLVKKDTSVRQALELIAGYTGLRYEMAADGVRILAPDGAIRRDTPANPGGARLIITIGPDGKPTIGWVLAPEDLPPEKRRGLEERYRKAVEQLPDGSAPAARPAPEAP